MRTTIDKAGRALIPAAVRDRAGWRRGSELEISPMVSPDVLPVIDIARLLEETRSIRIGGLATFLAGMKRK